MTASAAKPRASPERCAAASTVGEAPAPALMRARRARWRTFGSTVPKVEGQTTTLTVILVVNLLHARVAGGHPKQPLGRQPESMAICAPSVRLVAMLQFA